MTTPDRLLATTIVYLAACERGTDACTCIEGLTVSRTLSHGGAYSASLGSHLQGWAWIWNNLKEAYFHGSFLLLNFDLRHGNSS